MTSNSASVPASVPVDDAIARAAAVLDHADPRTDHWLALYLELHARPELSLQEVWTAGGSRPSCGPRGSRSPSAWAGPGWSACCATAPGRW